MSAPSASASPASPSPAAAPAPAAAAPAPALHVSWGTINRFLSGLEAIQGSGVKVSPEEAAAEAAKLKRIADELVAKRAQRRAAAAAASSSSSTVLVSDVCPPDSVLQAPTLLARASALRLGDEVGTNVLGDDLSADEWRWILFHLRHHRRQERLDVWRQSAFSDPQLCSVLARTIRANTSMVDVSILAESISEESAIEILAALRDSDTLREFSFGQHLGDEFVQELACMLSSKDDEEFGQQGQQPARRVSGLQRLRLPLRRSFSTVSLFLLAESLAHPSATLREFGCSYILPQEVRALEPLKRNRSLHSVDFSNHLLKGVDFDQLAGIFAGHPSLRSLQISAVGDDELEAVLSLLPPSGSPLEFLQLGFCSFSWPSVRRLSHALALHAQASGHGTALELQDGEKGRSFLQAAAAIGEEEKAEAEAIFDKLASGLKAYQERAKEEREARKRAEISMVRAKAQAVADAEFEAWQKSPEQQKREEEQVATMMAAAATAQDAEAPQEPAAASCSKSYRTLQRLSDNDPSMRDVRDFDEPEEFTRALLAALSTTTCPITTIQVVRLRSLSALVPQLAFVLARLPLLESLSLVECGLTDSNIRTLAVAIAAHPRLRSLSLLANGDLGDESMAALVGLLQPQARADVLASESSSSSTRTGSSSSSNFQGLTHLWVGRAGGSSMTHLSARMLSMALAKPGCTLTRLEWRGLSGMAAGALAIDLPRNSSLEWLTLPSSQVRGPALAHLIDTALRAHPTLQSFDIEDSDDTCWTDADLDTLARIVVPNKGAGASATSAKLKSDSSATGQAAPATTAAVAAPVGVLSWLVVRTHSASLTTEALVKFAQALDQSTLLRRIEVKFDSYRVDSNKQKQLYGEALNAMELTVKRNRQPPPPPSRSSNNTATSSSKSSSSSSPSSSAPRTAAATRKESESLVTVAVAALAAAWVYFKWM